MAFKCLVLIVLALFPICTLSQSHIEETVHDMATKLDGANDIENILQKQVLDTIIQEMMSGIVENEDNGTCSLDWMSLGHLTQTEKLVGQQTTVVSRMAVAADSFGKPQSGVIRGNVKYMGNFDECMSVVTKDLDFSMQYCQLPITVSSIKNNKSIPILTFLEAVCLPESCFTGNINDILHVDLINEVLAMRNMSVSIAELNTCTSQDGVPYTAGAVIMIIISFMFVILSITATIFDLVSQIYPKRETNRLDAIINSSEPNSDRNSMYESNSLLVNSQKPNRFIIFLQDAANGFSLYKTVPAVLSTSQPPSAITSINGMRVISMFWVILCHTYYFMFILQNFANPSVVMSGFVARFSAQPILNGFFCVDTFFFLSGLLVAYLTFRQMQRSKGRFPFLPFYVHRILRLTPTYMFVLFFYWYVTIHLGNGPLLNSAIGPGSRNDMHCKDYWWANLLYINNFVPSKFGDECMGWTWYLANDMQFYVISPLILIPLYLWLPAGLITIGILLVASIGVTGFIAGYYNYAANTFWPLIIGVPLPAGEPDQSSQIYGKPYCRVTPYLVGIVLGYVIFKKIQLPIKRGLPGWSVHLFIWLIAFILGMVNVYGLYFTWHGHEFSVPENVFYFMLSRFTWGVTLFLVVYMCHYGYGGVINRFLSMPFWIPFSRLTFNAYLVHEMILLLIFSEFRTTIYYSDSSFILYIISVIVLSFGAAGVISIFVEFPLSNLETAVFKLCGAPLRSSARIVDRGNRETASPLESTIESKTKI